MKTKIITSIAIASALTAGALAYADTNTGSTNTSDGTHKMQRHTGSGGLFEGFGKGEKGERGMKGGMGFGKMRGEGMGIGEGMMSGMLMKMGGMAQLTDAEKAKLATMTDAEKKVFFEAKRTEMEAKMEAREAVMDKLINGQALTTDAEKAIQKEIITQRAQMKKMREEMKAKIQAEQKSREEIKTIIEKKKSGATLADDEVAKLLDAFVNKSNQMKKPALANSGATVK